MSILILLLCCLFHATSHAMDTYKKLYQVAVINNFFKSGQDIAAAMDTMSEIQKHKQDYHDYANRRGGIWSDVKVRRGPQIKIIKEYPTKKVSLVNDALETHNPPSIFDYPAFKTVLLTKMLPKMFDIVEQWTELPDNIYTQIFLQRCTDSDPMDWHQDPGDDYDPQAEFSGVFYFSDQTNPIYGWEGGEFSIRQGLPTNPYDQADVTTIIPRYNQAIIFNNRRNTHAVTAIKAKTEESRRDIAVITLSTDQLPRAKE